MAVRKQRNCWVYPLGDLGIEPKKLSRAGVDTVRKLRKAGHEAYLVGGAVRDLLLGLGPKDYDVSTSAKPEQVRSVFRRAFIIGKRFRLVHVRHGSEIVEVSTFRKKPRDSRRKGDKRLVEDNTYGTAEQDAFRRDLTINALMLDPVDKKVLDYVGGIEDINKRKMRIIGNPTLRLEEDPVRIMRMLRLAAKLDFSIAKASLSPVPRVVGLLGNIPPARLFDEFTKVVYSTAASPAFASFLRHDVAQALFPVCARYGDEELSFIDGALGWSDHQFERRGKQGLLTFAISAIYWPFIAKRWNHDRQRKDRLRFLRELYLESGIEDSVIVPRAVRAKVWEMWDYQLRFQRYHNRPKSLRVEQHSYAARKAVAFLRYRNEQGEIGPELPDWWEPFIEMDDKARKALLSESNVPVTRKRRKRRRRKASGADIVN